MKRISIWLIAIILSAVAGIFAVQIASAPTAEIEVTDTPVSNDGNCAYMWAYHNAPELTKKLSATFLAIDPVINTRAEYFGEDCVYADGHSTFGAMETDFYIRIPVEDLTNEKALGNWMSQVLPVIVQLPREEIQGNYGFVEFTFEKTETERVIARVLIQRYKDEAQILTGANLFQMFYVKP